MMTDEQRRRVEVLKARIPTDDGRRSGAGAEVREAVLSLKRELRSGGVTARELASVLGVHETTLSRWERESPPVARRSRRAPSGKGQPAKTAAPFRMVQLADVRSGAARSAASPSTLGSRGLRVAHAPSGLIIEGLDVETLAALLRRMS